MRSAGSDLAVFTDFDGTLSAIVPDPPDARPVPGTVDAIARVVAAGAVCGVVSGRPVEFLQHVLGLDHVVYRGAHGLERAVGLSPVRPIEELSALAADFRAVRDSLAAAAASVPGALFEDKRVAFTLHYRNAGAGAADTCTRAASAAAAGRQFHLVPGRMCVEVLPNLHMDKGLAVEQEAHRAGARTVVFAGDDTGDIPAFEALDRLGAAGMHVVKVAVRSAESPPLLLEMADVVLDGPEATPAWLAALV